MALRASNLRQWRSLGRRQGMAYYHLSNQYSGTLAQRNLRDS